MMYRQINSPKEIAKRLAFLAYVFLFITFGVEAVVAIARPGVGDLLFAFGAFSAAALVRYAGYRWLDFDRLFESFPTGCALDVIPERVRYEVESLVHEFHTAGTDWVRRSEIRRRLIELEEDQPEIIDAYSEDLSQVLAA